MQEGYIERKESIKHEGYFSISHLLNKVHVTFDDGHTESFQILEGNNKNGIVKFQAFGGGAKLTQEGVNYLKKTYGDDIRFREGEEFDDARFYLKIPNEHNDDEQARVDFERSVLEPFSSLDNGFVEASIERELEHEFSVAAPGFVFQNDSSSISYVGAVSPRKWEKPGSARSDGAVMYGRVFHLFDMRMTESDFEKLRTSPNVKVLTVDDQKDIFHATSEGTALATLSDGSKVAENIFPDFEIQVS